MMSCSVTDKINYRLVRTGASMRSRKCTSLVVVKYGNQDVAELRFLRATDRPGVSPKGARFDSPGRVSPGFAFRQFRGSPNGAGFPCYNRDFRQFKSRPVGATLLTFECLRFNDPLVHVAVPTSSLH